MAKAKHVQHTGLERELGEAIDELQAALERAAQAAGSIRELLPRMSAIGSVFDEIDAVVRQGRSQIGATGNGVDSTVPAPAAATRPAAQPEPEPDPWAHLEPARQAAPRPETDSADVPGRRFEAQDLVCFRLEFESSMAPLDLRTVDDAVSEHPAVRDVALLDYDGRRATLKVWIERGASPSDVQQTLLQRSPEIFVEAGDVSIVALEDVA
jgi:hypothetical protein